jgi:hypothetical protein
MDFGIDESDPFGVGALFLCQSMAHRFNCADLVEELLTDLLAVDTPQLPDVPAEMALAPVDDLLDRLEQEPALIELVGALLRFGVGNPPTTEVSERLYRAVLWIMLRHDRATAMPEVLQILRDGTPGGRIGATQWPGHEFFAAVTLLLYLGDADGRRELHELLEAARDLDHHDLAPVLEWYLDHHHSAPARP